MAIMVLSRSKMMDLFHRNPDILDQSSVISITAPGESSPFGDIKHPNLLKLCFDDMDYQPKGRWCRKFTLFNREDAIRMITFIKQCHGDLSGRSELYRAINKVKRLTLFVPYAKRSSSSALRLYGDPWTKVLG